jgi:hypothetical protein
MGHGRQGRFVYVVPAQLVVKIILDPVTDV